MFDKLLDAIKDSYVLRFLVALTLTIVVCYLYINQQPVPEVLLSVWLFSLGYGTGIVSEKAIAKRKQQWQDSDSDLNE
jgi:hypothetical protein